MKRNYRKSINLFFLLFIIPTQQLFCTTNAENAQEHPSQQTQNQEPTQTTFTQDELSKILLNSLKTTTTQDQPKADAIKAAIKILKDYKITGHSVTTDANFAFFSNSQDPKFQVTYKNSKGELKTRYYQCDLKSIGWKLEIDLKLDFIFITGTDFNFYDSNKQIELGSGFDIKTPVFDLTYASFKNVPGSILIIGIPFLTAAAGSISAAYLIQKPETIQKLLDSKTELFLLSPLIFGLSYVKGGTLTPLI